MLPGETAIVAAAALSDLLHEISRLGYTLVGPTVRDGAIVYREIHSAEDLPAGWTDVQQPGSYRLARRADSALFGFAVGPHSWKQFLHQPAVTLWHAQLADQGAVTFAAEPPERKRLALIGVRSCELYAIATQDKVLIGATYSDPHYAARRAGLFVVAVNCTVAGGTCFCVSMKTGPKVETGYDLALTELIDDARHELFIEAGSERGAEVLERVPRRPADGRAREAAEKAVRATAEMMGRQLETEGLRELLYANLENSRWDEVATRCLACANCTMVCPTCFCTTIEDHTDLGARRAERVQRWDSCFTTDFSHLNAGSVRSSIKSRYRQWLTHKLASWIDQFGTSGCVGCGRCITWCPVGIDLTEEAAAIRRTDLRSQTGREA
jgi:formate hydrogenlyase subunit 6/NADH:ubiquinone oxidoreductase subunit I